MLLLWVVCIKMLRFCIALGKPGVDILAEIPTQNLRVSTTRDMGCSIGRRRTRDNGII